LRAEEISQELIKNSAENRFSSQHRTATAAARGETRGGRIRIDPILAEETENLKQVSLRCKLDNLCGVYTPIVAVPTKPTTDAHRPSKFAVSPTKPCIPTSSSSKSRTSSHRKIVTIVCSGRPPQQPPMKALDCKYHNENITSQCFGVGPSNKCERATDDNLNVEEDENILLMRHRIKSLGNALHAASLVGGPVDAHLIEQLDVHNRNMDIIMEGLLEKCCNRLSNDHRYRHSFVAAY
jgi:hypothetical protein